MRPIDDDGCYMNHKIYEYKCIGKHFLLSFMSITLYKTRQGNENIYITASDKEIEGSKEEQVKMS